MANLRSFADELEKVGARAGLKIIRRLLKGSEPAVANIAKAERLALTPGVLKKTRQGSQIRDLGTGLEGVSTLVAHPKKGITVRKLYDTPATHTPSSGGASRPAMITRKEQFAKEMQGARGLPQFHGASTTPTGKRMHFSEYIPGKSYASKFNQAVESVRKARSPLPNYEVEKLAPYSHTGKEMRRLHAQAEHRGYKLEDVGPGNVQITRDAKGNPITKAIDVLPFRKGEDIEDLMDVDRLKSMHAAADAAKKRLPKNPKSDPAHPHSAERTKQIKREAFVGKEDPYAKLRFQPEEAGGRRG